MRLCHLCITNYFNRFWSSFPIDRVFLGIWVLRFHGKMPEAGKGLEKQPISLKSLAWRQAPLILTWGWAGPYDIVSSPGPSVSLCVMI
jgi:hypothetical protein